MTEIQSSRVSGFNRWQWLRDPLTDRSASSLDRNVDLLFFNPHRPVHPTLLLRVSWDERQRLVLDQQLLSLVNTIRDQRWRLR